ncbi:MAG: RICIN domain-containing protein [Gordonibacter sp.]|nr:RICIN domain-containing protein [Gordonibacter sp.]
MIKRHKILACILVCILLTPTYAWGEVGVGGSATTNTLEPKQDGAEDDLDHTQDRPFLGDGKEDDNRDSVSSDTLSLDSNTEAKESTQADPDNESVSVSAVNELGLSGLVILQNSGSSKVVDIVGGSTQDAANVQLYSDNNSPAQRFRLDPTSDGYYVLVNVASGKVLDVANGIARSGVNVWQYGANGSAAQKWALVKDPQDTDSYLLVSALSPKGDSVLDGSLVLSSETEPVLDGANICVKTYDPSAKQGFHVRAITQTVNEGLVTIATSFDKRKGLDIAGASGLNSANVQIYSLNKSAAQRFFCTYDSKTGYYEIKNLSSGKVLDVAGASTADGANVQQYEANGSVAQKWSIESMSDSGYVIRSGCSGKVLDVQWGSATDSANVWLYSDNNSAAQRWDIKNASSREVLDGVYLVGSALSESYSLDINGGSVVNGGNVQIYTSNKSLAQKFEFLFDEVSGYYTIRNVNSDRVLDVESASATSGANVQQYDSNGTYAQKWNVEKSGDSIILRSACSGLALDVSGAQAINGANVQVWTANDTAAQQWRLTESRILEDGVFELRSALGTTLDAAAGGESEGTNIQVYAANGSLAQKYKLTYVSEGYYRIECIKSGLYVSALGGAGSNVVLEKSTGTDTQLWKPAVRGNGYLSFLNKASGSALDVVGASSASGANVQVHGANGSVAQQWLVSVTDVIPEGLYTIATSLNGGMVLDIANGSTQNGAALQVYESNSTAAQKFKVSKAVDGLYRIVNLASGKSLDVVDSKIQASDGSGFVQQWESGVGNRAQLWRFSYTGEGLFSVYSCLGDGNSCLDVSGAQATNVTRVGVYRSNGSLAQRLKFKDAGTVTYISYPVTLSQMVTYQKNNPYLGSVSDSELRAALDPSVSLGADYMQFSDLRYYSGLTGVQLDGYINTNGSNGVLAGKGSVFANAAQRYGLNEAYLVAHTCLESGWGKSLLATGTDYNGEGFWYRGTDGNQYWASLPGYEPGRYYNLFGIGAVDSDPHKGGVETAIKKKWNSIDAAIDGSAAWIASGYIYRSSYPQYTLYDMRWDIAESVAVKDRGWHQYATDVQWAKKIARLMNNCYVSSGVVSPSLLYVVPSYL